MFLSNSFRLCQDKSPSNITNNKNIGCITPKTSGKIRKGFSWRKQKRRFLGSCGCNGSGVFGPCCYNKGVFQGKARPDASFISEFL